MGANNKPNKPKGNSPKKGNDGPRRNQGKKGGNKLEKSARRNVNVSFQPGINAAHRGMDQANLDFQNQDLSLQSIGGGLTSKLQNLTPEYENRTAGISDDLQGALGRFSAGLNQEGLPASEVAANTAVYGTQGNNFFNQLASNDQRALQWNQSAEREGGLWERNARDNLQQDLSDTQQQYYNRIADLQEQKQPAILSELERLREQQQGNQQDKAYADMIAQLTGNALDSGGPPRRNPGNGNGNGNGNGDWGSNPGVRIDPNTGGPAGGGQQGPPSAGGGNSNLDNIAQLIQNGADFTDLPMWIRGIMTNNPSGGPGAWEDVQQYGPAKRQMWRRNRGNVRGLYNAQFPWVNNQPESNSQLEAQQSYWGT